MTDTITSSSQHSLSELTWIRLMRVYQQIDRRSAEIMKQFGLSVGRFDVLVHAGVRDGRTQQELADAMLVTKGNITQLLDSMEADDLLYRRRRGRTNLIHLTDKGRELRANALQAQLENIDTAMNALTEIEQHQLGTLLRKIDKNINNATNQTRIEK